MITGCLGQDGSYLSEYLISLGYYVVGVSRRSSTDALSYGFLEHLKDHERFELIHGDITDPMFLTEVICKYYPDEFYSLAAQSHVGHSFTNPAMTFQIDAASVVNILSLLQKHSPSTKFYQASTSELFGGLKCPKTGYTEESLLHPRSPYGVAKLAAHWSTINFREAYGMYACAGILFNHGGPRRGLDFVERKVTHDVARIKLNLQESITMGNIDAYRDWGHSKDYVKAMHLMLQQETPKEYVIATGEAYSIKDLLEATFLLADLGDYQQYIKFDEKFMRPSEVDYLKGNPSKAKKELNWKPEYNFYKLIEEMYLEDLKNLKR